jgi:hypothetical protein
VRHPWIPPSILPPYHTDVSQDTYTEKELTSCSLWCLNSPAGGRERVFIVLRDRAMMLLASQTAFRGESARVLLWSDLFQTLIPFDDISPGFRVPV